MDLVKQKFDERIHQNNSTALLSRIQYNENLDRLLELSTCTSIQKQSSDYRLIGKYDVVELQIEGVTVRKLVKKGTSMRFIPDDELFDVINSAHIPGHGGRDVMLNTLNEKYANITQRQVATYLQLCETCQLKKQCVRKSLVVKPIISNDMNSRCQV